MIPNLNNRYPGFHACARLTNRSCEPTGTARSFASCTTEAKATGSIQRIEGLTRISNLHCQHSQVVADSGMF